MDVVKCPPPKARPSYLQSVATFPRRGTHDRLDMAQKCSDIRTHRVWENAVLTDTRQGCCQLVYNLGSVRY